MLQKFKLAVVVAIFILISTPGSAQAATLQDNFNGSFDFDWYFLGFNPVGGVFSKTAGQQCGPLACASLQSDALAQFLRVSVDADTYPIYTNTDVEELDTSTGNAPPGQWTPTYNHPVVMETRIRWSSGYNEDGTGTAEGTNGVILWDADELGPNGPEPGYDTIGFSWIDSEALFGLASGLKAVSFVNQIPVGLSGAIFPAVDIQQWVDLKMVWSVNFLGIQTVTYYINNNLVGIHLLPVALSGLSVEMWNDNQVPNIDLTTGTITSTYRVPAEDQWIDIDYIKVTQ